MCVTALIRKIYIFSPLSRFLQILHNLCWEADTVVVLEVEKKLFTWDDPKSQNLFPRKSPAVRC